MEQTVNLTGGGGSLYELVGGMPFFERMAGIFYREVAHDPVLRALYPEADLGPAQERLQLFLAQYWGGPTTYSEGRGHPRLRMRHAPFVIGEIERDRWLAAMQTAVDELAPPPAITDALLGYFTMAADAMRNQ